MQCVDAKYLCLIEGCAGFSAHKLLRREDEHLAAIEREFFRQMAGMVADPTGAGRELAAEDQYTHVVRGEVHREGFSGIG